MVLLITAGLGAVFSGLGALGASTFNDIMAERCPDYHIESKKLGNVDQVVIETAKSILGEDGFMRFRNSLAASFADKTCEEIQLAGGFSAVWAAVSLGVGIFQFL